MKIGRNAGDGRFTSVDRARSKPATHVVETIKKPPAPAPAPKAPNKR
jgi:hypothetical protein